MFWPITKWIMSQIYFWWLTLFRVWIPNVFLAVKFWNCQTFLQSSNTLLLKFDMSPLVNFFEISFEMIRKNQINFYLHMLLEGLLLRCVSKIVTKFFQNCCQASSKNHFDQKCLWLDDVPTLDFFLQLFNCQKTLLCSVNNNFYKEVNLAICRVESDCSTESALQKQQQTLLRKTQNFCWVMHVRLW